MKHLFLHFTLASAAYTDLALTQQILRMEYCNRQTSVLPQASQLQLESPLNIATRHAKRGTYKVNSLSEEWLALDHPGMWGNKLSPHLLRSLGTSSIARYVLRRVSSHGCSGPHRATP